MLNLAGEIKNTKANGPEMRYTIFTQGCSHTKKCEGCHNPHTWSDTPNRLIPVNELALDIISEMPIIQGVTFSGGEPFDQAKELYELAVILKKAGLNIMCYTGYTYDELQELFFMRSMEFTYMKRLLEQVDILVDGPFDVTKRDNPGLYRGSSNQRMLYLEKGKIIKIE
jgi:anaerobic ribonucleoside-triphosphate reductase activating protein